MPRRRSFLLALAGLAGTPGCATARSLIPSMKTTNISDVSVELCGPGEDTPCEETDIPTDLDEVEGTNVTASDGDDAAVVSLQDRSVTIVGRIWGNGDPNCRWTSVDEVSVTDGLLSIQVSSGITPPLSGGCKQVAAASLYRIRGTLETPVERAHVIHYREEKKGILHDKEGEMSLDETIGL